MAEKQYKNYDERFLKEESSGSRPVISYTISDPDETFRQDGILFCKAKFEDGSYCQTLEDLLNLFRSGFIFTLENPGDYTIYSNQMTLLVPNGEPSSISIALDLSGDSSELAYMVTGPVFEQLN